VQNDTFDVSNMRTQPVAVRGEWNNIFRYAGAEKGTCTRLPGPYHFMTLYKTSTGEVLRSKQDVRHCLQDLTIYLPTQYHLSLALAEARRSRKEKNNAFACAEPIRQPSSPSAERVFNEAMEYKREIRDIMHRELFGTSFVKGLSLPSLCENTYQPYLLF